MAEGNKEGISWKGQCKEITFAPMRGIYLRLKIIYICTLKMNFFT
jgi:hypothetical protein